MIVMVAPQILLQRDFITVIVLFLSHSHAYSLCTCLVHSISVKIGLTLFFPQQKMDKIRTKIYNVTYFLCLSYTRVECLAL